MLPPTHNCESEAAGNRRKEEGSAKRGGFRRKQGAFWSGGRRRWEASIWWEREAGHVFEPPLQI